MARGLIRLPQQKSCSKYENHVTKYLTVLLLTHSYMIVTLFVMFLFSEKIKRNIVAYLTFHRKSIITLTKIKRHDDVALFHEDVVGRK